MYRETVILVGLLIATVLSTYLVGDLGLITAYAQIAVFVIAFAKVRFIAFEFMDLRTAPLAARLAGDIWIAGIGIGLIWALVIGAAPS